MTQTTSTEPLSLAKPATRGSEATSWTHGPARWLAAGFLLGSSSVGLVWSLSSGRVAPPALEVAEEMDPGAGSVAGPEAARSDQSKSTREDAGAAGGGLIDLNAAGVAELDLLPGVGEATARAIIEHRTKHGRFRSIEELDRVPGIGPAKLARIRPLVTVGP